MSNTFRLGDTVMNLTTHAKVVGFKTWSDDFTTIDGPTAPWPVLRSLRSDGSLFGGRWAADPAKCKLISTGKCQ